MGQRRQKLNASSASAGEETDRTRTGVAKRARGIPYAKDGISRRFAQRWERLGKLERTLALRRAQLLRLFRHRDSLRNDRLGRANLRLLLELGLPGPKAMQVVGWIIPEELEHMIAEVDTHPRKWSAESLGDRVKLLFSEKIALDIRHIECFDIPRQQVAAFYLARRRKRDAQRKRLQRASRPKSRKPAKNPGTARTRTVLDVLRGRSWLLIEEIAKEVRLLPAFGHLSREAMRQAIRRALLPAIHDGRVEQLMGEWKCDQLPYRVRLVRLRDKP